jgi:hypothetical protein
MAVLGQTLGAASYSRQQADFEVSSAELRKQQRPCLTCQLCLLAALPICPAAGAAAAD